MKVTKKVEAFIYNEVRKKRQEGKPEHSADYEAKKSSIEELEKTLVSKILELEEEYARLAAEVAGDKDGIGTCRIFQQFSHTAGIKDGSTISVGLSARALDKEHNAFISETNKYDRRTEEIANEFCARMEMGGDWETFQQLLLEV